MKMRDYLKLGFKEISPDYQKYLNKRLVSDSSALDFFVWSPPSELSPCQRFTSSFGRRGEKLKGFLIIPIYSYDQEVLGFEARKETKEGSKYVLKYHTDRASWNPYFLGAKKVIDTLWYGTGDIWLVEGSFDFTALERVVPQCDAVMCTLRAGMTKPTFDTLLRFCTPKSTIYIVYDNDEAGINKSEALDRKFKQNGIRSVIWKYRGKDPNEVLTKGGLSLMKRMFS